MNKTEKSAFRIYKKPTPLPPVLTKPTTTSGVSLFIEEETKDKNSSVLTNATTPKNQKIKAPTSPKLPVHNVTPALPLRGAGIPLFPTLNEFD